MKKRGSSIADAIPAPDPMIEGLFHGIAAPLDIVSDLPAQGSDGRLFVLSTRAAERAIRTFIGKPVNFAHQQHIRIGTVTSAEIRDGAIHVSGKLRSPANAAYIMYQCWDRLGLSIETASNAFEDSRSNPLVLTNLIFAGVAISDIRQCAFRTSACHIRLGL